MIEPKWIRLTNIKASGIPAHTHPDTQAPVHLKGKFSVRWPDGSVNLTDAKTSKVFHRNRDGTEESGPYTYFEGSLHGMSVIYNLHEVELRDDEVVLCLAAPRKTRAA